jgi:hypothetical protein
MALQVVKYTDFLPRMMRDITNYVPATAVFALQDAGREFCNRSEAWFEKLTAINIVADQQDYTLSTDYVAQFKRIKSIHILTSDDVTNSREGMLLSPAYYKLVLPNTLRFRTGSIPTTAVTGGLVVEVVFAPTLGTNELPAWLMARWSEAIIGHAMSKLLGISNPARAAFYLNEFNTKLGEAMVESMDDISPYSDSGHVVQVQEYTP